MKRLITSLLVLVSLSGFAASADNTKSNTKAEAVTPSSVALTMQQLQEENATLRKQIEALSHYADLLESNAAYQLLMTKMFARIDEERRLEEMEEMKAQVDYTKMMGGLFLHLKNAEKK